MVSRTTNIAITKRRVEFCVTKIGRSRRAERAVDKDRLLSDRPPASQLSNDT